MNRSRSKSKSCSEKTGAEKEKKYHRRRKKNRMKQDLFCSMFEMKMEDVYQSLRT